MDYPTRRAVVILVCAAMAAGFAVAAVKVASDSAAALFAALAAVWVLTGWWLATVGAEAGTTPLSRSAASADQARHEIAADMSPCPAAAELVRQFAW